MPRLTRENWKEWDALLRDVVAPYRGALNILTGKAKVGSPQYSVQTDIELFALIQRFVSSEFRAGIRIVFDQHGKLGSIVYHSLRRSLEPERGQVQFEATLFKQGEKEGIIAYIKRATALFSRAEACGLYGDDDDEFFNDEQERLDLFYSAMTEEYQEIAADFMDDMSSLRQVTWNELSALMAVWKARNGDYP